MKVYHKIKASYHDDKNWAPKKGDRILVQEKMDGANFLFGMVHGEFKIFSRNRDITNEKTFQKVNLDTVRALESALKERVAKYKTPYTIFLVVGELLGQGRVGYNKDVESDSDIKDIFIVFDIITSTTSKPLGTLINKELKTWDYDFFNALSLSLCVQDLGLKMVPTEEVRLNPNDTDFFAYVKDKYVEKDGVVKDSWYNPTYKLEGVVVKVEGTSQAVKIVTDAFKEKSTTTKPKVKGLNFTDDFIATYITEPAIEKYFQRLKEQGLIPLEMTKRTFSILVQNNKDLVKDIFDENTSDIIEMLMKQIGSKINKEIIKIALERIDETN